MVAISGWFGLLAEGYVEVSGSGYERAPIHLPHQEHRSVDGMMDLTAPTDRLLTFAAIFEEAKGGKLLMVWRLLPPCPKLPCSFPPMDVCATYGHALLQQQNRYISGSSAAGHVFDANTIIATISGQLVVATTDLRLIDGVLSGRRPRGRPVKRSTADLQPTRSR